jgi:hypothetical protein
VTDGEPAALVRRRFGHSGHRLPRGPLTSGQEAAYGAQLPFGGSKHSRFEAMDREALVPLLLQGIRNRQSQDGLVGVAIDDASGIEADLRNLRADGARPGARVPAGAAELKDVGDEAPGGRIIVGARGVALHRRRSTNCSPCRRRRPRLPPTAQSRRAPEGPRSGGRASPTPS